MSPRPNWLLFVLSHLSQIMVHLLLLLFITLVRWAHGARPNAKLCGARDGTAAAIAPSQSLRSVLIYLLPLPLWLT